MIPTWFEWLAILYLIVGGASALVLIIDLIRRPQHMWIMNVVWPTTALFGTVVAVYWYFKYGTLASRRRMREANERDEEPPSMRETPFPMMVAKGALHCGSGCTLGDICAEFLAVGFPVVAIWLGWKSIFPDSHHGKIFAVWILDFILAFLFGVAFQYFTIKPMRDLSPRQGLIEAVKADALSLTAWQIGMYGFMAAAHFYLFTHIWETQVTPTSPVFWFTMQWAMVAGFLTSYPVNWFLIRKGVKEKM